MVQMIGVNLTFSLFYFFGFCRKSHRVRLKLYFSLPTRERERERLEDDLSPGLLEWSNGGGGVENGGAQLRHSTFFSVQNCFAPFFQSNELLGPVNYTWQHTRPTEQNPVENLGFEPVR